jgi:hypothetical protein
MFEGVAVKARRASGEISQVLGRSEEIESSPQDGVVGGLAAVAGDGRELAGPIDRDLQVELVGAATGEGG